LGIISGDRVMTITSGGCNTLGFLLHDPALIYAVDINSSQSHLMELKLAATRKLDYEEFVGFIGLTNNTRRLQVYEMLKKELSEQALDFWDNNTRLIKRGIIMNGRYERFVKIVSRLIRLIQGKNRINKLFVNQSIKEQELFFQTKWNTWRTRLIFNLFFNKQILAKRGLDAEYFHFDDGSDSFAESFFNRFSHVLTKIKTVDNYFLHLYLKGKYRNPKEVPTHFQEGNYEAVKEKLSRINLITADAKKWLTEMPEGSINCFALSNICELMSVKETEELFKEVFRTATNGARICFRNLMIPREVPSSLNDKIKLDKDLSNTIQNNDRSFVYGKVAAYKVFK
jgi:S-adenosylmethionine-diacylglycerol 3-amino-3-carboxypropyl transferase